MSRLELPLDRFTPGDLFPNGPGQHSQAILASVHATLATVTRFLLGPHLDTSRGVPGPFRPSLFDLLTSKAARPDVFAAQTCPPAFDGHLPGRHHCEHPVSTQ